MSSTVRDFGKAALAVEKADLGDQQKIADTFHEAKLIPRAIDATDVKLWRAMPKG